MDSQLFATFCDDLHEKDVSNMLIYVNICSNGFDFEESDRKNPEMKQKFDEYMAKIEQEVRRQGLRQLKSQKSGGFEDMFGRQDSPGAIGELVDKFVKSDTNRPRSKGISKAGVTVEDDIEEPAKIKSWPKQVKMDICWRVPQDSQRVMIFEKLQYAVAGFEQERMTRERYADVNKANF